MHTYSAGAHCMHRITDTQRKVSKLYFLESICASSYYWDIVNIYENKNITCSHLPCVEKRKITVTLIVIVQVTAKSFGSGYSARHFCVSSSWETWGKSLSISFPPVNSEANGRENSRTLCAASASRRRRRGGELCWKFRGKGELHCIFKVPKKAEARASLIN